MTRKTKPKQIHPRQEVTCTHCRYTWHTKSKLMYVPCPNCRLKTLNKRTSRIPLTPEAELADKVLRHQH